jgi:hypothetical protein
MNQNYVVKKIKNNTKYVKNYLLKEINILKVKKKCQLLSVTCVIMNTGINMP